MPARIAVVEDDPDIADLVSLILQERGHEVEVFEDGAKAVLAVPGGRFDLVITDINMPRMDGLSFLRALRNAAQPIPAIVLSAREREEEILEAFAAGANDYLIKPCNPALLLAKLPLHLPRAVRMAVLPTPRELPEEGDLPRAFGDWQLKAVLGEGSFGRVYHAEGPRGAAALKLLFSDAGASEEDLARYFREVASLSLVDSPYVVGVRGYGELQGLRYLALEFLDGGSAYDELCRAPIRRLRTWRAATIGRDVVRGLRAIHAVGISHRDVKPDNILLRRDESAVLADFGLAKVWGEPSLTDPQTVVGTLEFVAPEVICGDSESERSDLYGLGATLYQLCSGRLPYETQEPLQMMRAIEAGRAPRLHEITPEVGQDFSQIVSRLMANDPDERPSLEEAERWLGDYAT